jgi:type I restriction enzyme M protein
MTVPAPKTGDASALIRKLWQYCNILRDDGLSYPDYVEQLTYLLFLKMSDEKGSSGPVPAEYAWRSFADLDAKSMHRHYTKTLAALGNRGGMLRLIFRNARNKIKDPAKLRLLIVDLIGQTEWTGLSTDLKGDAYEGLLEKNARDTKSGAGQYFTPRPLIDAIVECIEPRLGEVICDPACGTGGFLLAAHEYLHTRNPKITSRQRSHLRTRALRGVELVEEVARLAAMNLLLHGVSGDSDDELPIICTDSLKSPPGEQVDVVLTNPPFGVKGSVTYTTTERRVPRDVDDLNVIRPDFWVQTSNKQLNFLQHVVTLLKPGGRAAVVLPDNVLYESGAAAVIRCKLLETCDVHTLLRLPPGLFYAQGIKANVLFFDRLPSRKKRSSSSALWIYDFRSDSHFSLKTRPLRKGDLQEFVRCFQPGARLERVSLGGGGRWRALARDELLNSENWSLDSTWPAAAPSERSKGVARLDELSRLITEDLRQALTHIAEMTRSESSDH